MTATTMQTTDNSDNEDNDENAHPVNKTREKSKHKSKDTNQHEMISREAVVAKANKAPERRRLSRSCKRTADYREFY